MDDSKKVPSDEELDQMELVLMRHRKMPTAKISVENLDEIMERLDEVLRRCKKLKRYGKMADCIIQHVKTFHKQAYHEETAEFGEPCATCKHVYNCNHDWLSIMTPIFGISTVEFKMPDLPAEIKTDCPGQSGKQGIDDKDPVPHTNIPTS